MFGSYAFGENSSAKPMKYVEKLASNLFWREAIFSKKECKKIFR